MSTDANFYTRLAAGFVPARRCLELVDGEHYSFEQLDAATARAAHALSASGLVPGDRVSVLAEKSVGYLWLYLGCLRAGLIFHPLNPAYTDRELAFFLADAGTRLLVHDPLFSARIAALADNCPMLDLRLSLSADGSGDFADLCSVAPATFADCPRTGDDSAALLYSSGTTGTPKGIRITHDNLYSNARALAAAWAFSADDVLLHALPVFHVHGLFITLGPALLTGATLRFLPRFDVDAVIAALPGSTVMAGVPTYYTRLLAAPGFTRETCRTVRVFISGSAPLSEAVFHAFAERTGHRILERYGMTETGINTSNPLHGERKPGAVGLPLAGVEVRVVDVLGRSLAAGDIGAIQVRGPNVFPGYWQSTAASAAAFDDEGWFDTGDQGRFDADGYLHIVGRSKDMIISGGLNVYPKEIERELESLAGIFEAAVFGVLHDDLGEAVVAAVVSEPGSLDEAAVIATLKQHLASFKVPKRILAVADLPRNAMGKVQKNLLRERFASLFRSAAGSPPQ